VRRRHTFSCWLVALILALLALGSCAQMSAKKKVSQADLSGFTYPVRLGFGAVRGHMDWQSTLKAANRRSGVTVT